MSSFGINYGSLDNPNFNFPSSDVDYTGLVDSTQSFTGGNFGAGDVLLGSPVPLGTEQSFDTATVNDFGTPPMLDMSDSTNTFDNGALGSSDGGIVFGVAGTDEYGNPLSGTYANVNPNNSAAVGQTDSSTWAAFGALSKFGSSIATLFGAHPSTVNPNPTPSSAVSRGNRLSQGVQVGGVTGTNTILLVIVVGAIIMLLARSRGE